MVKKKVEVKKVELKKAIKKASKKTCHKENGICKVACMVFMTECQTARLAAAVGLFLGDKIDKHDLLKEYMAVDRTMRKMSADFHREIEETCGACGAPYAKKGE